MDPVNQPDNVLLFVRQYSNVYYKHWEKGTYKCVVCGIDQFSSKTKYDSGSGWPSFYDVINKENIRNRKDASGGECSSLFYRHKSENIKCIIFQLVATCSE